MAKRITVPLLALALLLLGGLGSRGQGGDVKDPDSLYALDLKVRKATEDDFGKRVLGVEIYTDGNTRDALFISEVGAISAVPAKLFKAAEMVKTPLWSHGLRLTTRPPGQKDWDKGKKHALEVFRDETSGAMIYFSEAGQVSVLPASYAAPPVEKGKVKDPLFLHGMNLKVRKAGEKDFTKDTKVVGIEVFRDANNDNLVYITETGAIAAVPAKLLGKGEADKKTPLWQHGLELASRKGGEKEIGKDTKRYGLEVFLDPHNGNIVYLCETGAIAVVPAKWARPTDGKSKAPDLKHAMDLKTRKGGQKDFDKDTKVQGVEVYLDTNNGATLYLSETGDLTVVSPAAS